MSQKWHFQNRLRAYREAAKLTQRQCATRLGTTQPRICCFESGAAPTMESFQKFARFFRVPEAEIGLIVLHSKFVEKE